MKHLIQWVGDHADLDNPGDKQALMELAAAQVFIELYFEWAWSPDHCSGERFDAMCNASDALTDLARSLGEPKPAPPDDCAPYVRAATDKELVGLTVGPSRDWPDDRHKDAPPDEWFDCQCQWETAEGVNPTRVYTCRPCLSAIEEDQVGDLRREVDGG